MKDCIRFVPGTESRNSNLQKCWYKIPTLRSVLRLCAQPPPSPPSLSRQPGSGYSIHLENGGAVSAVRNEIPRPLSESP
eukprot:1759491-Rhodomonas_salina.2